MYEAAGMIYLYVTTVQQTSVLILSPKSILCARRQKNGKVSLHPRVQTGSGAHPASYAMGTAE